MQLNVIFCSNGMLLSRKIVFNFFNQIRNRYHRDKNGKFQKFIENFKYYFLDIMRYKAIIDI